CRLGTCLPGLFSVAEGRRAEHLAQRVPTAVSSTTPPRIHAPGRLRPALPPDWRAKESQRLQPLEPTEALEPLPDVRYWGHVATQIREHLGENTKISWAVNNIPGIWVSFDINDDQYWLVFDREQLGLTSLAEWLGWGASALVLALIGAAISVRF